MPPTAPIPTLQVSRCSPFRWRRRTPRKCISCWLTKISRQGNTNGAIAQYRKAIAIDPHLPGSSFRIGRVAHTSSDEAVKKEAEQEYRAALRENPQDEKSILRLAEIDAKKGNTEQSYDEYSKAVELQPADADREAGIGQDAD